MRGQAIIQVSPEFSIIDQLFEVFIRGSDYSHIYGNGFAASDPDNLPFLEDPGKRLVEDVEKWRIEPLAKGEK